MTGAERPETEPPEADPRDHWSFRVPVRATIPIARHARSQQNPIDAFIDAKLVERKIEPLPAAEPAILLRRVYLDLIGLPPDEEQLREFLANPTPHAYTNEVDRLLASPAYGERWARHWMDVWRYADWHGRGLR